MASIALRQHVFKVGQSPFAHNFLVFYDDDGKVGQEFHGMARNPKTRDYVSFGRSSDFLEATSTVREMRTRRFRTSSPATVIR